MKFHLVLTKKDTDIIAFKNSVSSKTFGELVTKILKSAAQQEKERDLSKDKFSLIK